MCIQSIVTRIAALLLLGVLGCVAPVHRVQAQHRALRMGVESPEEALTRLRSLDLQGAPALEVGIKSPNYDLDLLRDGLVRLEAHLESLGYEALPRSEIGWHTPSAVWGFLELRFSRIPLVRTRFETEAELFREVGSVWSRGGLYGVDRARGLELVQPAEFILEASFDATKEARLFAWTADEMVAKNADWRGTESSEVPVIRCLISSDLLEEFFWQDYQPSGSGCHDSSSANADPESFESETFVDTHLLEYEPCAEELSKSEAALLAVKLWEVGVVTHLEFGMTHELYVSGSDWATVAAVLDQLPWLELRDEVYYPIRD